MISVLAAAALAGAPVSRTVADDPDVRCYAAVTLSLVGLQESGKLEPATLVSLTAIIWYYYGRMESRLPGVDFAAAIAELVGKPNYLNNDLQVDAQRCGAEAEGKGKQMQEMGKRLQELAPLMDHRQS